MINFHEIEIFEKNVEDVDAISYCLSSQLMLSSLLNFNFLPGYFG